MQKVPILLPAVERALLILFREVGTSPQSEFELRSKLDVIPVMPPSSVGIALLSLFELRSKLDVIFVLPPSSVGIVLFSLFTFR